jgi:hypothetical protein
MVGISFDYSFFEDWFPNESTKYHRWMNGRIELLHRLSVDKVINTNKLHHLLGCGLPQEGMFGEYSTKYPWIYSMDTSNPIVHGIKQIAYNTIGLESKDSTKLFTIIDIELDELQVAIAKWNVQRFREFWNDV